MTRNVPPVSPTSPQLSDAPTRGSVTSGPSRAPRAPRAPPLSAGLVALSNGLSRWVQLRVLRPLAAPQRAAALGQCLHLAQTWGSACTWHRASWSSATSTTLLAVVGGLATAPSRGCAGPFALLTPPLIQLWAQLAEAVARGGTTGATGRCWGARGAQGGSGCRRSGSTCGDLVSLEAALPDWGGPGRPHPNKLRARFALQGALLAGREQGPPGTPHPDLLRLLEVSLALGPSEEQLHQMSLQREPRESAPAGPPPELPPRPPPRALGAARAPPARPPRGCDPGLEQLVEVRGSWGGRG
ncbi:RAS guanyl-releasing protein 2-like [Cyanocitta cristata]